MTVIYKFYPLTMVELIVQYIDMDMMNFEFGNSKLSRAFSCTTPTQENRHGS